MPPPPPAPPPPAQLPDALPPPASSSSDMLRELRLRIEPLLEALAPMGQRRTTADAYGDMTPLVAVAALTQHVTMRVSGANGEQTFKVEIDVAEPYAWLEGGSNDNWRDSFEALRETLVKKKERGCFFTRWYPGDHYTLNMAFLSADGKSLTQVLIGAAHKV